MPPKIRSRERRVAKSRVPGRRGAFWWQGGSFRPRFPDSRPCWNLNTRGKTTTPIHAHTAYTGRQAVCQRAQGLEASSPQGEPPVEGVEIGVHALCRCRCHKEMTSFVE